ncbi:MAG TPA: rhomboid family intramembrane serine protease [Thermoanaerobaculia bacterium]|jgi:rhomboid protease GluP
MNEERRPRRPATPATKAIIIAIFAGLAVEILTAAWSSPQLLRIFGANLPMAVLQASGEYWRLLTSMFLHGDGTPAGTLLHLAVNLVALFQLGTIYEMMFGSRRFVIIYFAAGIIASITSALNLDLYGSSVGASGAIAGILGALISSIFRSPKFRHNKAARGLVGQCVFWIIVNVAIASQMQGIDHFAHAGGLLAGLLLGALLPHRPPPPPTPGEAVIDVQPYD